MIYKKICFLDIETTGLAVATDQIIEIGIVKVKKINDKEEITSFHTYINPDRSLYMDPKVYAIHGLSLEFLRDKPLINDVLPALIEFVEDCPIVIHNLGFD